MEKRLDANEIIEGIKNGETEFFLSSDEELADVQCYLGEDLSDVEYCGGSGRYPGEKWYYATYHPTNEEINFYTGGENE
jgi:hypothetical protein